MRLKGPYLLGRGGEEVLHCREHDIDVDVVPCVTSALSAPLAGGIPVTHRGVSARMLVLSSHDALSVPARVAWPHTIVILMGTRRLGELTAILMREGKDAATPVGVVRSAWTPEQQVVKGALADIAEECLTRGVGNPSVIVIGDVVTVLPDAESAQMASNGMPLGRCTGRGAGAAAMNESNAVNVHAEAARLPQDRAGCRVVPTAPRRRVRGGPRTPRRHRRPCPDAVARPTCERSRTHRVHKGTHRQPARRRHRDDRRRVPWLA